ncbi:g7696 [Coccomyxa viridis]|uniref:G7696 protein n=1 Tax=Coccomyxa viridis TaxID=1274662 RepID=A0ABP1G559_9CHLO
MGWSEEVHARRVLDIRRQARKAQAQAPGTWHAEPPRGNAGYGQVAAVVGVLAGVIAWRREGRYLRHDNIKKVPVIGKWLAEHVPRWQESDPRRRAATAAERRARAAQRAGQSGKGDAKAAATAGSSLALTQEVGKEEASTSEHTQQQQQQQGMARKPRARKKSKRK